MSTNLFASQFSSIQISNNELTGKTQMVMSQTSKQRTGNSRADEGGFMQTTLQPRAGDRA
jgi:hypothetical protein